MKAKCKCGFVFAVTKINSQVTMFRHQQECNNLLVVCPNCRRAYLLFDSDYVAHGLANHFKVFVEAWADEVTYRNFLSKRGYAVPEQHELSEEEEKEVEFFRHALDIEFPTANGQEAP